MNKKGFTLIELLVVVALIALLSSVILASLSSVKAKARDARRIQDINTLEKTLAFYNSDNQMYPVSVSTTTLDGTDSVSLALVGAGNISAIPQDPTAPATSYTYSTDVGGTTYMIAFCLETSAIRNYAQGCGNVAKP